MFEKNLEAIDNLALKRRLSRISPVESRVGITYCVTPSNDYVLLKDDIAADDLQNPREAIRKVFEKNIKSEMRPNDIIINFGIGLGYLLDETFNKYPSRIFIYEPDLNFLHFVLNNVDISEHLASGRVFITNDLDELSSKLSSSFITKDRVEIVYLPNYAVIKSKDLLMLTQRVFDACKSKIVDVNTITRFSKQWTINTINNIATVNERDVYLLSELEHKFEGKTALIAAAGPSLDDNITKIQANRNNFVVFAVNKVVKYLIHNGIFPDFIVCLDAGHIDETLSNISSSLGRSNCILDIRTDSNVFNHPFHKFFVSFADTDFFIKKLAQYNGSIKFYEVGGSAATLALVSAVKMGFSRIIFSGLDLAFKDNMIYSDGEQMNRISQEQILVNSVPQRLIQVKSVTGGNVYTREDYASFIYHFETLIKELRYPEIYNTTSFGAAIEGVRNISFDELIFPSTANLQSVAFVEPFKIKTEDFVQDEFYHFNKVIAMLSSGTFSPALVSTVTKSALLYQYLQTDILDVLQKNFDPGLAEGFLERTKLSIKTIVELLQKRKLT